jgi:hypothetical protein
VSHAEWQVPSRIDFFRISPGAALAYGIPGLARQAAPAIFAQGVILAAWISRDAKLGLGFPGNFSLLQISWAA